MDVGDEVQIYHPKAMGRIGVVVGFGKGKVLVTVRGVGTIPVEPEKVLLVKKGNPDEIQWIRRRA